MESDIDLAVAGGIDADLDIDDGAAFDLTVGLSEPVELDLADGQPVELDVPDDMAKVELVWSESISVPGDGDYNHLLNRPSIEGVTLEGDKTFEDLHLTKIDPQTIWDLN